MNSINLYVGSGYSTIQNTIKSLVNVENLALPLQFQVEFITISINLIQAARKTYNEGESAASFCHQLQLF
jgi:hypothetical protein